MPVICSIWACLFNFPSSKGDFQAALIRHWLTVTLTVLSEGLWISQSLHFWRNKYLPCDILKRLCRETAHIQSTTCPGMWQGKEFIFLRLVENQSPEELATPFIMTSQQYTEKSVVEELYHKWYATLAHELVHEIVLSIVSGSTSGSASVRYPGSLALHSAGESFMLTNGAERWGVIEMSDIWKNRKLFLRGTREFCFRWQWYTKGS